MVYLSNEMNATLMFSWFSLLNIESMLPLNFFWCLASLLIKKSAICLCENTFKLRRILVKFKKKTSKKNMP